MRRMQRLPLVLTLLASACAAGPDYVPPQPPSLAGEAFVTREAAFDAANPLPDDWWRLYRDPVLDGLIAQAFAANADLRVAAANLARAQAVLQESRAGRLPSTDLEGGVSYGDAIPGGGSAGPAEWSSNAGLSLAWEVDLFGRVGRAITVARADAEAVAAARDGVRVTVAAEVTRAYLNACAGAFALDVARRSYATSSETEQLVSAQERAGSAALLDVERARAAAATARAAIPALDGQRRVALFELAALLGGTPADVPDAARACTAAPEPVMALPVGDGAALLRRRPDLRQAERQLAADTARIGVATAELYPRISLGGSGNFFRNDQVRGSDSFSFSLGPLISWSFPNVAVARARLREAQAQGAASLARFDGQVVTALKEVEQALTIVATEQARLDALHEAQARSEAAYRLAELRYRAGSIGQLDLLATQADLLTARAAYAAALQSLSSARVDLFKALGGGWQAAAQAER
ncbi:MAG TPA: efflux transporter outer membrane subunit [Sphingobium sp.]|nr:efflux transporter outer membrane subunit [Sphingobium sp.]